MKFFLFLFLLIFIGSNCETANSNKNQLAEEQKKKSPTAISNTDSLQSDGFSYNLEAPRTSFAISNKLKEISGISISGDQKQLVAVNDEEGKIFFLNKDTGEIEEFIKFHKSGDYEGIEMVGEKIYTVKSNGTIYEVSKPGSEDQDTKTHKTFLNVAYDVEGLGYLPGKNYLLLACKAKAGKGDQYKKKRAVYAFELGPDTLLSKPIFVMDRMEIRNRLNVEADFANKIIEVIAPDQSAIAFAPSGIAIHPVTGEIYVVSSAGKILVILEPGGKLSRVIPLSKSTFQQPEGICFDSSANLFISSEGKRGRARIFSFDQILN